jgi:LAO/AO transport system kinase
MAADVAELVAGAVAREARATARLVTLFEDQRPSAAPTRARAIAALESAGCRPGAAFVGITGTPGAGKSTLIAETIPRLSAAHPDLRIAILAVDPSSPESGGSLLGDRTRMRKPTDPRKVYFRSQPSSMELGGMGRSTFQVCRLLDRLFDLVLVETVGIGQNEVEVSHLADVVYLVLQPLGGDEVQFLKAGIMEIPDVVVLNKCDAGDAAARSLRALRAGLSLSRPGHERIPILRTSGVTGEGIDELAAAWASHVRTGRGAGLAAREPYHFARWVLDEFGRHGLRALESLGGASALLLREGGWEPAQVALGAAVAMHGTGVARQR